MLLIIITYLLLILKVIGISDQTFKIFDNVRNKIPLGLHGLTFYTYFIAILGIIPSIITEIFYKKSKEYSIYTSCVLFLYLVAGLCVIIYNYNQGFIRNIPKETVLQAENNVQILKKERIHPNHWKFHLILLIIGIIFILWFSFTLKNKGGKYLNYLGIIGSIIFATKGIPYTYTLYKYGDKGVSAIYNAIQLIADIAIIPIVFGTNPIMFIIAFLGGILFVMNLYKIDQIAQTVVLAAQDPEDIIKTKMGMKYLVRTIIISSIILLTLVFYAKGYFKIF